MQEISDTLPGNLFAAVKHCLMIDDPFAKACATQQLFAGFDDFDQHDDGQVERIETPGIPSTPKLVSPQKVSRRGFGSKQGRAALLHALAHIEFNAINLALDAVYRFRQMPAPYARDWLQVASDESRHFVMVSDRLQELSSYYGAMDAHAGLWNMALKTDHDVMVRMALVPRVMEARGLDVAPPMIAKFRQHDDEASAGILDVIFNDEIQHVLIGNHWFRYTCEQRNLRPSDVFADLLRQHSRGVLKSPFNTEARIQAGFSTEELDALKDIEAEWAD